MESLMKLLVMLAQKVPYLSEAEQLGAQALLRDVEKELGLSGVVAPPAADANIAPEVPAVDPGPVATPVPPAEQTPPVPTFGGVPTTAAGEDNVFNPAM